ncbi:MAG: 8-amino-7-oxononanoate synthase [Polyangiaceae bacterium]
MSSARLSFVDEELTGLEARGLLRRPRVFDPSLVNLSSNDYLGFGEEVVQIDGPGGATASPLVTGYSQAHQVAESALASFANTETALLFSSGYAANVGLLSALAGPEDVIFSDRLNHASIVDGCRLSRARICIYEHLSIRSLRQLISTPARRRFIVTESLFSMDGDSPPLRELHELALESDSVLIVDESHAVGVAGPEGRGLCFAAGFQPDVLMFGLGKAFGLQGGAVASSPQLRLLLWNRARSLVYSTGVSPLIAELLPERVRQVLGAGERRTRLEHNVALLRKALAHHDDIASSGSAIIPLLTPDSQTALAFQRKLFEAGFALGAIRPPTVPTPRVRLVARCNLSERDLLRFLEVWSTLRSAE